MLPPALTAARRAVRCARCAGVITVQDPPMHEVLPLWAFPLCSSLCSATASICTQPIDVVKTRLQVGLGWGWCV